MVPDCAGVRVRDLERAHRSYPPALGLFELGRGTMAHGGAGVLREARTSRQRLRLNGDPPDSPYASPYARGEELDHLGVRTSDEDLVYVEDPDGVSIELIPTAAD
jgi:catechol 2,3-dioxygenase-like lactoylglutathione lyase family enzyme